MATIRFRPHPHRRRGTANRDPDGIFGGRFPKAGSVMAGIYVVGIVLVYFATETKGRALPD